MPYTEKRKRFIIGFAYVAVILLIVYLVFKYLLGILMPFIIGFVIASVLSFPARYLSKRLSLAQKFVSFTLVLLFYATVGTLLVFAFIKLFVGAGHLFSHLPELYNDTVAPALSELFDSLGNVITRFDSSIGSNLFEDAEISLGSAVSAVSVRAVSFITGVIGNLPLFILEVALTVISTFFFAADYTQVTGFVLSVFPRDFRIKLIEIKKCLMSVMLKYGKSYFTIMLITFGELFLGLTVAGMKSPFVPALLIALFDILPVFGVGLIIVPWGIINLITGEVRSGTVLLVLYVVIWIVRNIIEPKIVGREVGLHPILALISMFVGTRLFGFFGLFGLPVTLSVAKSLYDCGVIGTKKTE